MASDAEAPTVGVRAVVHPSDPYDPLHAPAVHDVAPVGYVPISVNANEGTVPVGSDDA